MRKLISQERDPDASHSIQTAVTEMDRIEVAMETVRVPIIYYEPPNNRQTWDPTFYLL